MKSLVLTIALALISLSSLGCGATNFKGAPEVNSSLTKGADLSSTENGGLKWQEKVSVADSATDCPTTPPVFKDALAVADASELTDAEIIDEVEAATRNNIVLATTLINQYETGGCAHIAELTKGVLTINQDLLSRLESDVRFRQFTVQAVKARIEVASQPGN
jgi:hypothetical protein